MDPIRSDRIEWMFKVVFKQNDSEKEGSPTFPSIDHHPNIFLFLPKSTSKYLQMMNKYMSILACTGSIKTKMFGRRSLANRHFEAKVGSYSDNYNC